MMNTSAETPNLIHRLLTITRSFWFASSFVEVGASHIEAPRQWVGSREHIYQRAQSLFMHVSADQIPLMTRSRSQPRTTEYE